MPTTPRDPRKRAKQDLRNAAIKKLPNRTKRKFVAEFPHGTLNKAADAVVDSLTAGLSIPRIRSSRTLKRTKKLLRRLVAAAAGQARLWKRRPAELWDLASGYVAVFAEAASRRASNGRPKDQIVQDTMVAIDQHMRVLGNAPPTPYLVPETYIHNGSHLVFSTYFLRILNNQAIPNKHERSHLDIDALEGDLEHDPRERDEFEQRRDALEKIRRETAEELETDSGAEFEEKCRQKATRDPDIPRTSMFRLIGCSELRFQTFEDLPTLLDRILSPTWSVHAWHYACCPECPKWIDNSIEETPELRLTAEEHFRGPQGQRSFEKLRARAPFVLERARSRLPTTDGQLLEQFLRYPGICVGKITSRPAIRNFLSLNRGVIVARTLANRETP